MGTETGTPQQEYFLTIWDERRVDWKQFVTELPEEDKQAGESKMQLEGEADSAVNSAEQPAGNMDFPGNVTESMEATVGSKQNEGIQSTDAADVEQKVAVQEVAAQEVGTVGETADSSGIIIHIQNLLRMERSLNVFRLHQKILPSSETMRECSAAVLLYSRNI